VTKAESSARSASRAAGFATTSEAWLALHCRAIDGVSHGCVLLSGATGGAAEAEISARWSRDAASNRDLEDAGHTAMRMRRVVIRGHPARSASASGWTDIAVPFGGDATTDEHLSPAGSVAIRIDHPAGCEGEPTYKSAVDLLQAGLPWLASLARDALLRERIQSALQILVTSIDGQDARGAAMAAATELATHLGVERVSIGFLRARQMELAALSHSAGFDSRSNLIGEIAAAMEEAADQDSTIAHPDPRSGPPRISLAHEELVRSGRSGGAWTVPLVVRGDVTGAITFELPSSRLPNTDVIEASEIAAALVGPVLDLRREVEQSVLQRIRSQAAQFSAQLVGPGFSYTKVWAIACVAVLGFLFFAEGEFRISADSRLEGRAQRAIVAGIDGYISEALARAGDTLEAGALMGRLDDRDLALERRNAEGRRAQLVREYREAVALHDRSGASILNAELEQADAEMALIDAQLARTELIAPFEGVVVKGDLSQSLGSPVERGTVLFEIAPLDGYRIILEVDERDISHVAVGQTGRLALTALPNDPLSLTVRRILPVSVPEEGRNYFRVEAQLNASPKGLRPGMEGVAKIDVGSRRRGWI